MAEGGLRDVVGINTVYVGELGNHGGRRWNGQTRLGGEKDNGFYSVRPNADVAKG